ncbi:MAG: hypothetical protein UY52_C0009G0025 [Parcubacteria group bacterium GW2011_GWC2_49_9]|nr:MAG: hypothetical protein UY52_C0009G0025 [Parcubacteria group bacterium GW2011_GWC2_49_9]
MRGSLLNLLRNHLSLVLIIGVGLVFLIIYSWLYSGSDPIFTSPDETANYYFSQLFAAESKLRFHDPLNEISGGLIHPRSMAVRGGELIPGSFLGMPLLYGSIAKVFGIGSILKITPILAVIGAVFFYFLIKDIFLERIATISTLLLLILPPFFLYSSRGMFHNVPFVSFFIVGLFFLVHQFLYPLTLKKRLLFLSLSGVCTGLSLALRTSEIFWVLAVFAIIFLSNLRRLSLVQLVFWVVSFFAVMTPILVANTHIYGSALSFAYSFEHEGTSSMLTSGPSLLQNIGKAILPFGINFSTMKYATYDYLLLAFGWWALFTITGAVWILRDIVLAFIKKYTTWLGGPWRSTSMPVLIYTLLFLTVSLVLVVFYGSFEISEYFDKSVIILGSSYIRYWLPVYIFGIPFVVVSLFRLGRLVRNKWISSVIQIGVFFVIIFISLHFTFLDPLYGIAATRKNTQNNIHIRESILSSTEEDSIVITGNADKVIFPERRVIVDLPLKTDGDLATLRLMLKTTRIYVYTNPLNTDVIHLREHLIQAGFTLSYVTNLTMAGETLEEVLLD